MTLDIVGNEGARRKIKCKQSDFKKIKEKLKLVIPGKNICPWTDKKKLKLIGKFGLRSSEFGGRVWTGLFRCDICHRRWILRGRKKYEILV